MHNCKLTRNLLLDYALGEESTPQALEALAQMGGCPPCQAEFAAIRRTLRVSGQALSTIEPAEEFWQGYHARLSEKLVQQQETQNAPAPNSSPHTLPLGARLLNAVRSFATASVRLPAPAAIAILLLVGFLTYNMLSFSSAPANASASSLVTQERIVEVPVIQERVVTRTVYVERKPRASQGSVPVRANLTAAGNRRRTESLNKTAMSLAGFKPTDQVKLTVIKGSYQDEK
ncbi:MAG TPA: hypothetical protein VNO50_15785 [Pyrinomonadaceae bacterium]|nr:hypothetical protein [Pyrinomonadaceae bacterium]